MRPREDLFSIGPLKRFDCWSLVRGEALCSAAPSRWTTPGLCVGCDKELLRLAALWRRLMRMFWWTLYSHRHLHYLQWTACEHGFLNNNLKFSNWLSSKYSNFYDEYVEWRTTFRPPVRHGFTVEWGHATKALMFTMIFRTGRFRAPGLTR